MRAVKTTLVEIIILVVVGCGLAFTVNAVRAKGSLKVTKDYFDRGGPVPSGEGAARVASAKRQAQEPEKPMGAAISPNRKVSSETSPQAESAPPQAESAPSLGEALDYAVAEGTNGGAANAETAKPEGEKAAGHIQHDYQSITLKEVIEVFNDPLTSKGLNVFVDARNDQHFEEGHIPGAVQFDPYEVEQYLDGAMEKANAAEKVIVYCNGGDCEDSIYASRELLTAGVPYESIYLFEGGWKEWTAANQPVSQGREE